MVQRFASDRDTWLSVLGISSAVLSVAVVLPILMADIDGGIKAVLVGSLMLNAVLVSWVYFGTFYIVDGNELRIRSGPFRWRVVLKDIHRVSPTRSPWSSPALSLNRLRIEYGNGKWVLVSPVQRSEFIRSLDVRGI